MIAGLPFREGALYRIDQTVTHPGLMLALAVVQLAIAAVFFALANWGTSDIARLNHFLGVDPSEVPNEPFWLAIAPLIVVLPYRVAQGWFAPITTRFLDLIGGPVDALPDGLHAKVRLPLGPDPRSAGERGVLPPRPHPLAKHDPLRASPSVSPIAHPGR